MDNGESYEDVTLSDPSQRKVSVHEDREGTGEWRVEYFDAGGGRYVTIFAGPEAERRARDYFSALKGRWLNIIRAADIPQSITD